MKKLFGLLLSLYLLQSAYPCGNEYGYALDGTKIYTQYFFLSERMLHFDHIAIKNRIKILHKKEEYGTADYKTWSDIAANLMKIGQADSAINILRPLLKKHPNEYNLIANLGTCYELTGELDSALKYISKGYELNPKSHLGSEWIHVKILEAKLKNKAQPGWINKHAVIELDELLERVPNEPKHFKSRKINRDFFYQIRTRVQFTPPPNPTIANLLITLGDYNQKVGTYENALLAYTYALKFGKGRTFYRKVKEKIKILNQQREAQANIKELPDMFLKMMRRSEIDPEILLMGIDDYAEQLDAIHLTELSHLDSLANLKYQNDSLTSLLVQQPHQEHLEGVKDSNKYLFLGIGLLLGILITGLFWVVKRK